LLLNNLLTYLLTHDIMTHVNRSFTLVMNMPFNCVITANMKLAGRDCSNKKLSCRKETVRLLHGSVLAKCNWETIFPRKVT